MKRLVSVVAALVVSTGLAAPVTVTSAHAATTASISVSAPAVVEAASPVPGRFCKRADRGTKVKTARYGTLVCRADKGNDRYSRWYHA